MVDGRPPPKPALERTMISPTGERRASSMRPGAITIDSESTDDMEERQKGVFLGEYLHEIAWVFSLLILNLSGSEVWTPNRLPLSSRP